MLRIVGVTKVNKVMRFYEKQYKFLVSTLFVDDFSNEPVKVQIQDKRYINYAEITVGDGLKIFQNVLEEVDMYDLADIIKDVQQMPKIIGKNCVSEKIINGVGYVRL